MKLGNSWDLAKIIGDVLRTQYTLYSFLKIITKPFTNLVAALDFSLADPFENEKCIL